MGKQLLLIFDWTLNEDEIKTLYLIGEPKNRKEVIKAFNSSSFSKTRYFKKAN